MPYPLSALSPGSPEASIPPPMASLRRCRARQAQLRPYWRSPDIAWWRPMSILRGSPRCARPGDCLPPMRQNCSQLWRSGRAGHPQALDVLLGAPAEDGPPELALSSTHDLDTHPRVARSYRMRTDVSVYQTEDGAGILTLGRGLAGRWEAGFEVAESARNRGLGRRLAAAARHLIPQASTSSCRSRRATRPRCGQFWRRDSSHSALSCFSSPRSACPVFSPPQA